MSFEPGCASAPCAPPAPGSVTACVLGNVSPLDICSGAVTAFAVFSSTMGTACDSEACFWLNASTVAFAPFSFAVSAPRLPSHSVLYFGRLLSLIPSEPKSGCLSTSLRMALYSACVVALFSRSTAFCAASVCLPSAFTPSSMYKSARAP